MEENLPTFNQILAAPLYGHSHVLKLMQRIENAGHGDSVERELLNLNLNYGRNRDEMAGRLFDMMTGRMHKMYSYNGWNTIEKEE
jgi:hypothetical protein